MFTPATATLYGLDKPGNYVVKAKMVGCPPYEYEGPSDEITVIVPDCDPDNCETCVDRECEVCGGDPDLICCDGGSCVFPCTLVDGESCETPLIPDTPCGVTCVLLGAECGIGTEKEWSGITEKVCDTEGCLLHCFHFTHWCWKKYACEPSGETVKWTRCGIMTSGFPPEPVYWWPVCVDTFPLSEPCETCKRSDYPIDTDFVDYDFCF